MAAYSFSEPQQFTQIQFYHAYDVEKLKVCSLTTMFKRYPRPQLSEVVECEALFESLQLNEFHSDAEVTVVIEKKNSIVYTGLLHLCTFLKFGKPTDTISISSLNLHSNIPLESAQIFNEMPQTDVIIPSTDEWRGFGSLFAKLVSMESIDARLEALANYGFSRQINSWLKPVMSFNCKILSLLFDKIGLIDTFTIPEFKFLGRCFSPLRPFFSSINVMTTSLGLTARAGFTAKRRSHPLFVTTIMATREKLWTKPEQATVKVTLDDFFAQFWVFLEAQLLARQSPKPLYALKANSPNQNELKLLEDRWIQLIPAFTEALQRTFDHLALNFPLLATYLSVDPSFGDVLNKENWCNLFSFATADFSEPKEAEISQLSQPCSSQMIDVESQTSYQLDIPQVVSSPLEEETESQFADQSSELSNPKPSISSASTARLSFNTCNQHELVDEGGLHDDFQDESHLADCF
jgi:hypothetical protein